MQQIVESIVYKDIIEEQERQKAAEQAKEVDSIYLTKEDLDKIMAADLSKYGKGHEVARDIFMVGVWTAQRISDYNNINRGDINTLTKNIMHEDPDPENPGETIAWIEKKVITYIKYVRTRPEPKYLYLAQANSKPSLRNTTTRFRILKTRYTPGW